MKKVSLKDIMNHAKETGADIDKVLDAWNKNPDNVITHYRNRKANFQEIIEMAEVKGKEALKASKSIDDLISVDIMGLRRILDTLEHTVNKEYIGGNLMVMVRVTTLLDDRLGEEEHMIFDGDAKKTDEGVVNAIDACISEMSYRLLCSL